MLSLSLSFCTPLPLSPNKVCCQLQSNNRVWRRRKLTKKDDMLRYKLERIPFLEEQVRKVKEGGKLLTMDIERLLLSEDNRFDFVNEVAAEATEYVEKNRDEYGGKPLELKFVSQLNQEVVLCL
ncbi:plastid transcriptionally active7 [Euphorbia peplus]|nr:plastid transcriptionally active7 [Euphorbia peplus]